MTASMRRSSMKTVSMAVITRGGSRTGSASRRADASHPVIDGTAVDGRDFQMYIFNYYFK
jgi:hypothetical protein